MNLTEDALLEEAGETSFYRGEDYVRYVHGLRPSLMAALARHGL